MSIVEFENELIDKYVERNYLDYSLYVITDRAIPHVGDGLKPVQRRIIYAMYMMGLYPDSKYKKSARTVGDVIGKYHPHGDSAVYEAMVIMAQGFNYRYPLVDGQGNWGSQDNPKSFAAMRYTESKLAKNALPLLSEVKMGACEYIANYDGTEKEPDRLPSMIPNILLNPCSGIAVGLATDIPPHNLYEVYKAVDHLIKHPSASLDSIMQHLPAPDQPTGAEIVSTHEELKKAYMTGNGSYRARAVWSMDDGNIVISRLPHQVSGSKIIEQIADLMKKKKLPQVEDIRDESDQKEPVRIVIVLTQKRGQKNEVVGEEVMNYLFASTQLENSYKINMNVIGLDNRPHLMGIKEIITNWIQFRKETIERRVKHRVSKIDARLHIIEGLLVAYLNLDRVIEIIRQEDKPKQVLMSEFNISDVQADAILDMKLRHLAKLEEMTLNTEKEELLKEKEGLLYIISSDQTLSKQVIIELAEIAKPHKNTRISSIKPADKAKVSEEVERGPSEDITVILSQHDWIKTIKGHDIEKDRLTFMSGDSLKDTIQCSSNDTLYIIDTKGRVYNINCYDLPNGRGNGDPLAKWIQIQDGLTVKHIGVIKKDSVYLASSDIGYGFMFNGVDLLTNQKKGKAFLNTGDGQVFLIKEINDEQYILAISEDKHALIFSREELPLLNKGKGNKIINLPNNIKLVHLDVLNIENDYEFQSIKFSKPRMEEWLGNRAKRGKKIRFNLDLI